MVKKFNTEHYDGYTFKKENKEGNYVFITFSHGIEVQVYIRKEKIETIHILNQEILYGHNENIKPKIYDNGNVNDKYQNVIDEVFVAISEQKEKIKEG